MLLFITNVNFEYPINFDMGLEDFVFKYMNLKINGTPLFDRCLWKETLAVENLLF